MQWKTLLLGSLAVGGLVFSALYFWMRFEGADRASTHDVLVIGMLCCFSSFALRRWGHKTSRQ